MQLKALFLQNFRCYQEALFTFSPHFNLIVGPNALGKTSILEAIALLFSGKSFRTTRIGDLIREGEERFLVEAVFLKHGVEQRVRLVGDSRRRRLFLNRQERTPFSSLFGLLCGVLISPDDAALIKGAPAVRRSYLDLQLAQADPLYVHHLARYMRAMRQRNALLKQRRTETIAVWEETMAASAAYVSGRRRDAALELQERAAALYAAITGEKKTFSLAYKCRGEADAAAFLRKYQTLREREMQFGCTLTGPHRDELKIAIGEQEARFFGSEGQQRCCVATLRFSEWERLREQAQFPPLMLVDDIGISLDASRRRNTLQQLAGMGQVFLTATEAGDLGGTDREVKTIPILLKTSAQRESR